MKRRLLIALYAPAALALAVGPAAAGSDVARAGALEPGLAAGPTTPSPSPAPAPSGHIDVIEVAGLVDRVVADFLERSLRSAETGGAEALVLQLDSAGAVVPQSELDDLVARISRSRTPVAVWVGPSGARAYGGAFELVRAAFVSAMAPGTHVGREQGARATGPRAPVTARLGSGPAVGQGLVTLAAPTLGDFVVGLNGRTPPGAAAPLVTARVVQVPGRGPRLEPVVQVRFGQLGLWPRVVHSAASPSVAELLLVAGCLLVVFEFFTAGVGVAAAAGVGCLVLASMGLADLPTRPWAVVLVVVGCLGFAVDVQAGAPRVWTGIGTAAVAAGAVGLVGRGFGPSPWAMAAAVVGTILFMVGGMPAVVRARFSTPTIGRESMLGEVGRAVTDVSPEGTVELRSAPWRARTNRATPIRSGEPVRVVGIDGLLLEVEPEGSAHGDHRHRQR
ncbi:MAG: hypothetical protein E6G27_17560 [Actinobacteria bacterium]|nr:MAG: hypothetical protein E6G27_17560 [Actinomycetota bacterium]